MLIGSDVMRVEFHLFGDLTKLAIPSPVIEQRSDRLWEHSCFEVFLADPAGQYTEVNLSPSSEWASYRFDSYRNGMQEAWLAPYPHIETAPGRLSLVCYLELRALRYWPTAIALSAVIEEKDGTKSYWALRHPPGEPDFHHPDCFALTLEAPDLA
jgi:hypothetical protein